MITAVCVFLPVGISIAIGEILSKLFPDQMDMLLERVCGK